MTSRVELDIDASQEPLALAFAEPRNNPIWMHDFKRFAESRLRSADGGSSED
jgi:hypothetical protein